VFSANNPDLSAFAIAAQVIILHGLADQLIRTGLDRLLSRAKTNGRAARAAEFCVCSSYPASITDSAVQARANMNCLLLSLVAWVEEGKAPDQLLGEGRDDAGKVIRTRPIFPYPQTARYTGTGDSDDARNFVSQTPVR
jgi:feruloyl esterase